MPTEKNTKTGPLQPSTFYGDDTSTFYVDRLLGVWLVQDPDMVGSKPAHAHMISEEARCNPIRNGLLDLHLLETATTIDVMVQASKKGGAA